MYSYNQTIELPNNQDSRRNFYENSFKDLEQKILEYLDRNQENNIIVAISRKGPRNLKFIFNNLGKWDKFKKRIVTEHALPFLFKKENALELNQICLMDDAIYYGSTAESTAIEIKLFYNENKRSEENKENEKIAFYATIQSKESKPNRIDGNLNIIAPKAEENNYGQYFVKRLTSNLRSLNSTLEIEFPIIEYNVEKDVNCKELLDIVREVYKDRNAYVYDIENLIESSYKRDERNEYKEFNFNINILLERSNENIFNKLRIFYEKGKIRIVAIAPRPVDDNDRYMKYLFDNIDGLQDIWYKIHEKCYIDIDTVKTDNYFSYLTLKNRSSKTLVVLANYLYSFETIIKEKDYIESIINKLQGDKEINICKDELYLLTSDEKLNNEIVEVLIDKYNQSSPYNTQLFIHPNQNKINYQVFESPIIISNDDIRLMQIQNEEMLKRCRNLQECLSTLFFNQDMLIEKLTRIGEDATQQRLRFGYTFDAIYKTIEEHCPNINIESEDLETIHQWVDRKIDEGCIVPQYIVDNKTENWYRVFRPGENEDALLSHLGRFCVFVFNTINEKTNLGWVERGEYENLLVTAFNAVLKRDCKEERGEYSHEITESRDIKLFRKKEENGDFYKLYFRFINSKKSEQERSVVEYMIDMFILSEENNIITISNRMSNKDMLRITTLETETEKRIINSIEKELSLSTN